MKSSRKLTTIVLISLCLAAGGAFLLLPEKKLYKPFSVDDVKESLAQEQATRFEELIEEKAAQKRQRARNVNSPPEIQLPAQISVEGGQVGEVRFSYKDKEDDLDDISFTIRPAQRGYFRGMSLSREAGEGVISFVASTKEAETRLQVIAKDTAGATSAKIMTVKITKPTVTSCVQAADLGWDQTGYYDITSPTDPTKVDRKYCEMESYGGGWTRIAEFKYIGGKEFIGHVDQENLVYREILFRSGDGQFIDYDYKGKGNRVNGLGLDRFILLFSDGAQVAGYKFPFSGQRSCSGRSVEQLNEFSDADFRVIPSPKYVNCGDGGMDRLSCPVEIILTVPENKPYLYGVTDNNTVQKSCFGSAYYRITLEVYGR